MWTLIEALTGARRGERARAFLSFLALFFLLLSYYLIKPLRNSQFLKDFNPRLLPLVYLFAPILSFAVTRVFNAFYDRIDKYRLIIITFLLIMGCKVAFFFLLRGDSKGATIAFYYWASVYFLLSISTLWACINDIFSSGESERCFGFVAMGATFGNIAGARVSSWVAGSVFSDYPTLISAACMGTALGFILLAERSRSRESRTSRPGRKTRGGGLFKDVAELMRRPYVRGLAVMVYCLALFNTGVDFLSQKMIDRRMAEQQYLSTFVECNHRLNHSLGVGEDELNGAGFELVYGLKSRSKADQLSAWQSFLRQHPELGADPAPYVAAYADYRKELETKTRTLFSDIYYYQGVLGLVLLGVVARAVFRYFGLAVAASLLPIFSLGALLAFLFPLELLAIETILVVGGALNYSLNNATKEILYTPTPDDTKFKHKPLIEGPGTRLGDVTASLLYLAAGALLGETLGDKLFLGLSALVVVTWMYFILRSGRTYDRMRRDHRSQLEPDD